MKTEEELNELRKEVEAVRKKLAELSEEELSEVAGGAYRPDITGIMGKTNIAIFPALPKFP